MLKVLVTTIFLPALFAASLQGQREITDGNNASEPGHLYSAENYPYQVAILRPSGSLSCGGSIVSIWCVLTAANCEVMDTNTGFRVIFGSHSITDYDKVKNERLVEEYQPHPLYVNAGRGYDILILKVHKAFVFDSNVQPVVIRAIAVPPTTATATGWGLTGGGDENSVPKKLQELTLNIVSYAECTRKWGILPANVTCASYPDNGTCTGDNGGPLVQRDIGPNGSTEFVLIGITSFRDECADTNLPGIFTNVLSYLDNFILPTARLYNRVIPYYIKNN